MRKVCEFTDYKDKDDPSRLVTRITIKYRENTDTYVFQIVKYHDGELKHIHCKNCENEWSNKSKTGLSTQFFFNEEDSIVKCLVCGTKVKF